MAEVVKTRFKQLSKTSTEWVSLNPTLLEGEIGFESDTNKLKVGNGVDAWNNLEYVAGNGSDVDASNLVDLTSEQTITGVKTFDSDVHFGNNYMQIFSKFFNRPQYDNNVFSIVIGGGGNYTKGLGYSNNGGGAVVIAPATSTAINDGDIFIGLGAGYAYSPDDDSYINRIAIGHNAQVSANDVIQLGAGTNSNTKTFQVFDYQMLDGNTGKIPTERLNLGTKKYLHRIKLNLSDQVSGTAPTKMAVIHLDYYSEQETAYTNPNFATIALANSIRCSGYYTDTDTSLTEKNFVYEIALPQSNEFVLNSSFSITIQSTGSSITDEVVGYIFS